MKGEREGEGRAIEKERERESVCVCVCVVAISAPLSFIEFIHSSYRPTNNVSDSL